MTDTAVHPSIQPAHATPKPPPRGWRRALAPGWLRVPWMTALFFGIGLGIVVGLRALAGWDPVFDWLLITTVAGLTAAPIGFLAGLGAFDYWTKYALGAPTERVAGATTSASTPTTR
jgi:hypothetical protein